MFIDHLLFRRSTRLVGCRCNYFHLRQEKIESQISNYLLYIAQLLAGRFGIQTQVSLFQSPCTLFDMMN